MHLMHECSVYRAYENEGDTYIGYSIGYCVVVKLYV